MKVNLNEYTMKQLLLAAALARKIRRKDIVNMLSISESYYTKMTADPGCPFYRFVDMFRLLEPDEETRIYKGVTTLQKEVARLIYKLADVEENKQ